MSIDNYGMRKFRRFKTILNLAVDTPLDNLEMFCNKLREEIHINPIMLEDKGQIYVHDISESSIQILVNVFFQTSSASVELEERQKFIFIIMKNASDLQIKIARPQYI
jgi:MscS family membrane protein